MLFDIHWITKEEKMVFTEADMSVTANTQMEALQLAMKLDPESYDNRVDDCGCRYESRIEMMPSGCPVIKLTTFPCDELREFWNEDGKDEESEAHYYAAYSGWWNR